MSPERTFRKISRDQARIIWQTVKKTPTGGFKHISKAARAVGVSRQTLYDFLTSHPEEEKTRKIQPDYVQQFEKSEGYKMILRYNTEIVRVTKRTLDVRLSFAEKCFVFLNKRDPVGWTLEDFKALRNNPAWFDKELDPPQMGSIKLGFVRSYVEALGHSDWLKEFYTKGTKRAAGQKRHWYLRKADVQKVFEAIEAYDAKTLFIFAVHTGNRIGAYMDSTFANLHLDQKWPTWNAFESKTKQWNENELTPETVEVMQFYIERMKQIGLYGADKKMFPHTKEFYIAELRNGLKKAGLAETVKDHNTGKLVDYGYQGIPISWHITRHTFASLLAQEGVELQYIMQQGPWSDAKTLLDFYAGIDRTKVRESMAKLKLLT